MNNLDKILHFCLYLLSKMTDRCIKLLFLIVLACTHSNLEVTTVAAWEMLLLFLEIFLLSLEIL